jgi:tetratricopeptide (TPR) repeat protein
MTGEKFSNIKSNCYVRIAHHHNNILNNYETSIDYYKKGIKLNQNNFYAHQGIASAYAILKRFNDALTHFNHAISLKPKDSFSKHWLIIIYEQVGNDDEY